MGEEGTRKRKEEREGNEERKIGKRRLEKIEELEERSGGKEWTGGREKERTGGGEKESTRNVERVKIRE